MTVAFHLAGWAAVILMAAHSYGIRRHLDPERVLEHRAGLPAVAAGVGMMIVLGLLAASTRVLPQPGPVDPPQTRTVWVLPSV